MLAVQHPVSLLCASVPPSVKGEWDAEQSSDLTTEFLLIGSYRPCALPGQTPQESYRGYGQSYFTDGETEAHVENTLSGMKWKWDLTPRILVPKHPVRDPLREMTLQSEEGFKSARHGR